VSRVVESLYLGLFSRAPVDHIRAIVRDDSRVREAVQSLQSGDGATLGEQAKILLYLAGISHSLAPEAPRFRNRVIEIVLSQARLDGPAKPEPKTYDLFISYNKADKEVVMDVVRYVERRGLSIFVDKVPVESVSGFLPAIERGLTEVELGYSSSVRAVLAMAAAGTGSCV